MQYKEREEISPTSMDSTNAAIFGALSRQSTWEQHKADDAQSSIDIPLHNLDYSEQAHKKSLSLSRHASVRSVASVILQSRRDVQPRRYTVATLSKRMWDINRDAWLKYTLGTVFAIGKSGCSALDRLPTVLHQSAASYIQSLASCTLMQ